MNKTVQTLLTITLAVMLTGISYGDARPDTEELEEQEMEARQS